MRRSVQYPKNDIRTLVPTNGGDWLAKFGERWKDQVAKLKARFGNAIEEVRMPMDFPTDVPIVYVARESIIDVLGFAKSEAGFEYNFLSDITATDEEVEPRFEVVYNLYSMPHKNRIRFKVRVTTEQAETVGVPTAVGLWLGANWAEREAWDMFGVKFAGHPDLRRILMDERWQGHPLRKDYPLRGYQVFTTAMDARPELLDD